MIKTLSIGDIHGRTNWKVITHGSYMEYKMWDDAIAAGADAITEVWSDMPFMKYDKIIFVGDYVDSFTSNDVTIKHNLIEIINFKKRMGDKVVLLLGNHDVQYIVVNQICSGHRSQMRPDLSIIFGEELHLFTMAYQLEAEGKTYLWTHAGVTSGWLRELEKDLNNPRHRFYDIVRDRNPETIADKINLAWEMRLGVLYNVDHHSGGWQTWAGPLWVRPHVLNERYLENVTQIVGHTAQAEIWSNEVDENTTHYFIDVTEFCDDGLQLEV